MIELVYPYDTAPVVPVPTAETSMQSVSVSEWFPVIEPILKQYGIPDDFKYLCVIESNLSNVVSPAGAAGGGFG